MRTDTKVCIGVTVAIVALVAMAGNVLHVNVLAHLAAVGFFFLIGLPTYIWHRRRRNEESGATTHDQYMRIDRCKELLDEVDEWLDGSIAGFQEWGKLIKNWEKDDERGYYGDKALAREVGMHTYGLSHQLGKDVGYLISIRRKLYDVRRELEPLNPYRIA